MSGRNARATAAPAATRAASTTSGVAFWPTNCCADSALHPEAIAGGVAAEGVFAAGSVGVVSVAAVVVVAHATLARARVAAKARGIVRTGGLLSAGDVANLRRAA